MPVLPPIHKSRLHQIINIGADKQEIVIRLVMTTLTAQCPNCQQWSQSIHSHYVRRLADLPWGGVPVRIELKVRRFRCSTPGCQHRYFTERVAEIALPYRRHTNRFQNWLSSLAGKIGSVPFMPNNSNWKLP